MKIFIRKGEHVPRNKVGCKKGYYPERHLNEPKRGLAEGARGIVGKTKSGHTQIRYCLPTTAPVHRSRATGKLYSGVFHKWQASSKPTKKIRTTVFDKTLRVAEDKHPTLGIMGVKFEDHWELPKPKEDED